MTSNMNSKNHMQKLINFDINNLNLNSQNPFFISAEILTPPNQEI